MNKLALIVALMLAAPLPPIPPEKVDELKKAGYGGITALEILGSKSLSGTITIEHGWREYNQEDMEAAHETTERKLTLNQGTNISLTIGTTKKIDETIKHTVTHDFSIVLPGGGRIFSMITPTDMKLMIVKPSRKTVILALTLTEPHRSAPIKQSRWELVMYERSGKRKTTTLNRRSADSLWLRIKNNHAELFSGTQAPLESRNVKPAATITIGNSLSIKRVDPAKENTPK